MSQFSPGSHHRSIRRRDLQTLLLPKPGVLGGIERLVVLGADAAHEGLVFRGRVPRASDRPGGQARSNPAPSTPTCSLTWTGGRPSPSLPVFSPRPTSGRTTTAIRSVVQTTRVLVDAEVADGLHDLAGVVAELHQGVEIGAPAGRLALESRGGVVRVVHLEEAEIHEEGIGILCVRLTSIDGDQCACRRLRQRT
jgi:hypothetical protein